MLIFVGQQGIGKSRLLQVVSRGFCTDSVVDIRGKEAYQSLEGSWFVELAELAATRKSDSETLKNFISKPNDTFRPAYGRNVVTRPRQCVFCGTTNEQEVLRDATGNRRMWPVRVRGTGDRGVMRGLEAEVDQLWAEAMFRRNAGESLWLDDAAAYAAAEEAQSEFRVQDELEGMIEEFLDRPIPPSFYDWDVADRRRYMSGDTLGLEGADSLSVSVRKTISISEIRCELCGEDPSKGGGNDLLSRKIANIMNNMKEWTRGNSMRISGYGKQRIYTRSE